MDADVLEAVGSPGSRQDTLEMVRAGAESRRRGQGRAGVEPVVEPRRIIVTSANRGVAPSGTTRREMEAARVVERGVARRAEGRRATIADPRVVDRHVLRPLVAAMRHFAAK